MNPVISIRNITKAFRKGLIAVDDVSLDVEEGEFITLLGPSGCGKSTMLRIIAGFEEADSGSIFLAGTDVTDFPPYRREVNMVFQDYALFPHMNVAQNVGYGLRVSGVPKDRIARKVEETLALVELADKADNRPSELSGGQRQRVSLARALARDPKVLLLDEPLSALDANLREAMQVELKHLHEKLGITFVMVTHDQTEALAMADRIVVMKDGKVSQCGTPADLYDKPANPYVARFIGTANFIDGKVMGADDRVVEVQAGAEKLRIARVDGSPASGDVRVCIRPEKLTLVANGVSPPAGENRLSGTVDEILYHGANARVRVAVDGQDPMLVDVQLKSASLRQQLPGIGSPATVCFSRSDAMLFGEDRDR